MCKKVVKKAGCLRCDSTECVGRGWITQQSGVFNFVEVNEEGGVRGGVKGGLVIHKRHHESWNGF